MIIDFEQLGMSHDWNENDPTKPGYIKNRPFYTGDPVETVLVEESTVSFTDNNHGLYIAQIQLNFVPTVGETYKVSWDGTVYECTCVGFSGQTVIGNLSIAGAGSDTGEPFVVGVMGDGETMIFTLDTSASHTFSISGSIAEVVKIDRKYIPALDYLDKNNPTGAGSFSMNRKINSNIGEYSVALGKDCVASGNNSISVGADAKATELVAQAFGWLTEANARFSHAEGCYSKVSTDASEEVTGSAMEEGTGRYGHAEGFGTLVTGGAGAHAEGALTSARGSSSHAEGYRTTASGSYSHAEGYYTTASGERSHAEGAETTASGWHSHAECSGTTASGSYSHAEGAGTTASGSYSHAECNGTTASGDNSHAEGYYTTASGECSHAEGYGTIASSNYQHVQGQRNIEDPSGTYADIVGNGTPGRRSNAYTLDWEGNAWYSGTIEGKALIIPSSTEGSTKKFKITVDDSGTISATEIVAAS